MTHLQDVAYSAAADLNPTLPFDTFNHAGVTPQREVYCLSELAEKSEYCHGVRAPHVQDAPAHRSILVLDGVLEVVVGLELLRRQGQNLDLCPQQQQQRVRTRGSKRVCRAVRARCSCTMFSCEGYRHIQFTHNLGKARPFLVLAFNSRATTAFLLRNEGAESCLLRCGYRFPAFELVDVDANFCMLESMPLCPCAQGFPVGNEQL